MSLGCNNCRKTLSFGFPGGGGFLAHPVTHGEFPVISEGGNTNEEMKLVKVTGDWRSLCPTCIQGADQFDWRRILSDEERNAVRGQLGLSQEDYTCDPGTLLHISRLEFLSDLIRRLESTAGWTSFRDGGVESGYPEVVRGILALAEWIPEVGESIWRTVPYSLPGQLIPPGELFEMGEKLKERFEWYLGRLEVMKGRCLVCAKEIPDGAPYFRLAGINQITTWQKGALLCVDEDFCCQIHQSHGQPISKDSPQGLDTRKTEWMPSSNPQPGRIQCSFCTGCYARAFPGSYSKLLTE